MATSRTPVLDREALEIRHLLLQLAAALDRVERGDQFADDPRWARIEQALQVVGGDFDDRAQRVQHIFSRPYEPNWRDQLGVRTERVL